MTFIRSGTLKWVNALSWSGKDAWQSTTRDLVMLDGFMEGYVRRDSKLSVWWINRAGHSVSLRRDTKIFTSKCTARTIEKYPVH
jgi:hypothetical protein